MSNKSSSDEIFADVPASGHRLALFWWISFIAATVVVGVFVWQAVSEKSLDIGVGLLVFAGAYSVYVILFVALSWLLIPLVRSTDIYESSQQEGKTWIFSYGFNRTGYAEFDNYFQHYLGARHHAQMLLGAGALVALLLWVASY